jgi:uncharacterized oxidoreductase
MKITGNTILITGGSSGIGLAIAEEFLKEDNNVLICGRSERKLAEAREKFPMLKTRICDLGKKEDRIQLFNWAISTAPDLNMLFNNAGIQKEVDFATGATAFDDQESEIEINLTASIHLCALFVQHFLKRQHECAIINVTSGLAFVPLKIVPVYCATKAALHSFTISLRSQLKSTNVRVFEIAPPIVKTALHREAKARKQSERGIPATKVAEATLSAIKRNQYETIVGEAKTLKGASRLAPHFFHRLLNKLAG